jgi:uncharacterized protein YnzC (UPF0291/DUF896 family)
MVDINRINELAKKAKNEGLSPEEKAEQDKLRNEYRNAMKNSLQNQLENMTIVDDFGNKKKPTPKKEV